MVIMTEENSGENITESEYHSIIAPQYCSIAVLLFMFEHAATVLSLQTFEESFNRVTEQL